MLDVQLYPREVRAVTTGSYRIENRTGAPIAALHLTYPERLQLDRVELAGASLDRDWPDEHYRIYKLEPAMQPGEVRELRFTTTLAERGFPNASPLTRIVDNGTFLDNTEITPSSASRAGACSRIAPSAASTACRSTCGRRRSRTTPAARATSSAPTATGSTPTSRSPPTPIRRRSRRAAR